MLRSPSSFWNSRRLAKFVRSTLEWLGPAEGDNTPFRRAGSATLIDRQRVATDRSGPSRMRPGGTDEPRNQQQVLRIPTWMLGFGCKARATLAPALGQVSTQWQSRRLIRPAWQQRLAAWDCVRATGQARRQGRDFPPFSDFCCCWCWCYCAAVADHGPAAAPTSKLCSSHTWVCPRRVRATHHGRYTRNGRSHLAPPYESCGLPRRRSDRRRVET